MKTKMIIKFNTLVSSRTAQNVKEAMLNQWHDEGAVMCPHSVDIQAIILENEKGEITVINLTNGKVKKRSKIIDWIKNLFKRKSKGE